VRITFAAASAGRSLYGGVVRRMVSSFAALVLVAGCGGGGGSGTTLEPGPMVTGFTFTAESAVSEGGDVDVRYTCDGEDVSPALLWEGVPDGTSELAVAVDDPDAPGGTFTHWLAWGIDPGVTRLPEGVPADSMTPGLPILRQGRNDFGRMGYGGPCPPRGEEHRYIFRLFALDGAVDLEAGADRSAFDEAVGPHVLAEARLTARYTRP